MLYMYHMKRKTKIPPRWKPVQLPKEVMDELEAFADSKLAKSFGFTSKSHMAAFAIREFLSHYSDYITTYELVDVAENQVTLIDHELDKVIKLVIDDKYLFCPVDKEHWCDHVKFVVILPAVRSALRKWGYAEKGYDNFPRE